MQVALQLQDMLTSFDMTKGGGAAIYGGVWKMGKAGNVGNMWRVEERKKRNV